MMAVYVNLELALRRKARRGARKSDAAVADLRAKRELRQLKSGLREVGYHWRPRLTHRGWQLGWTDGAGRYAHLARGARLPTDEVLAVGRSELHACRVEAAGGDWADGFVQHWLDERAAEARR